MTSLDIYIKTKLPKIRKNEKCKNEKSKFFHFFVDYKYDLLYN